MNLCHQMSTLSFDAWKKTHPIKLKGLNLKEQRRRYQQYLITRESKEKVAVGRSMTPTPSNVLQAMEKESRLLTMTPTTASRPITKYRKSRKPNNQSSFDKLKSVYLAQMLDPWAELDAKFPDECGYPSTSVNVKHTFSIKTESTGQTDKFCLFIRDGITRSYAPSLNEENQKYVTYQAGPPAGWIIGGTQSTPENQWVPMPEAFGIQDAFVAYRPVAMGVKLMYQAAPLGATGRICAALWPAQNRLPESDTPLTYAQLAKFEGAKTYPAADGCTLTWRPYSADGVAQYRPTKYSAKNVNFSGSDGLDPQSCDIDPTTFIALVHNASAMTIIRNTSNANYTSQFWRPADARSAVIAAQDASLAQQSPCLCILGEGLVASTAVYNVEVSYVFEAIADNRTFSLAQPLGKTMPASAEAKRAVNVVNQVDSSHAGGSDESHKTFLQEVGSTIEDIGSGLEAALDVGGTIASLLI